MGTIRLKRKLFFAIAPILTGAANAAGIASVPMLGMQMYQDNENAEAQEQQAQEQAKLLKQQNKALNNIAESAKNNPVVAMQAAQVMQKGYSAVTSAARNVGRFGKDVWNAWGKNWVKSGLEFGLIGGAVTYGANKWIQHDMKKEGIQMPNNTQPKQLQYSSSVLSKNFGEVTSTAAKESGGVLMKAAAPFMYGSEGMGALASYYTQKKALKAQSSLLSQKSYSFKEGVKNLVYGVGLGNSETIKDTGFKWASNSKSSISRSLGKFMMAHPKGVARAGIPIGLVGMSAVFGATDKLSRKPFEMVDNNAFAWSKSQNEQIY